MLPRPTLSVIADVGRLRPGAAGARTRRRAGRHVSRARVGAGVCLSYEMRCGMGCFLSSFFFIPPHKKTVIKCFFPLKKLNELLEKPKAMHCANVPNQHTT